MYFNSHHGVAHFFVRLKQVINNTLEVDIPQYAKMNVATGRKLKQLLGVVSRSVPFKPNMTTLATVLDTSRNSIPDFFIYLEEAGLIAQLRDNTRGVRGLGKVDKVYLDNTCLCIIASKKLGLWRSILTLNCFCDLQLISSLHCLPEVLL